MQMDSTIETLIGLVMMAMYTSLKLIDLLIYTIMIMDAGISTVEIKKKMIVSYQMIMTWAKYASKAQIQQLILSKRYKDYMGQYMFR